MGSAFLLDNCKYCDTEIILKSHSNTKLKLRQKIEATSKHRYTKRNQTLINIKILDSSRPMGKTLSQTTLKVQIELFLFERFLPILHLIQSLL